MPWIRRVHDGRCERPTIRTSLRAYAYAINENLDAVYHHFYPHGRNLVGDERSNWVAASVTIVAVAIADVQILRAWMEPHPCQRQSQSNLSRKTRCRSGKQAKDIIAMATARVQLMAFSTTDLEYGHHRHNSCFQ